MIRTLPAGESLTGAEMYALHDEDSPNCINKVFHYFALTKRGYACLYCEWDLHLEDGDAA